MASGSGLRASSSSSPPRRIYDVFLSFRGEDTRHNFTDHLHAALKRKGIIVFRDDEKLKRGESISGELFKAVCESEYAIVVISHSYAFSKWCLIELAKIVECMKKGWLKVLPIFYHVNPSDMRNQKGIFAEAFFKHITEKKADEKQMNTWRDALEEVSNLAGWDARNRYESEIVEDICTSIHTGLSRTLPNTSKKIVGIEFLVEEMMTLLHVGRKEVHFIGICGMGGIGKTTLAEVVYDAVSSRFEDTCFIANIREESTKLVDLQQKLLSQILKEKIEIPNTFQGAKEIESRLRTRSVFIVLDDVDKEAQLNDLAQNHDWFGRGSRILVTSRDKGLLKKYVDEIYEVKGLNDKDGLELFSCNAFKKCYPKEGYELLSKDIVNYAGGLPLALEVFGSFLFDISMDAWENVLDRIKKNPNAEILDRLQISYNGLEDCQKELFLDIACFFKGQNKDKALPRLLALGHYVIDIDILVSKSLIKISKDEEFEMHDLLQEMGHQIVYHESPKEIGKRSRLWHYKDILNVLKNNSGTGTIKGIVLKLPLPKPSKLSFESFSNMNNLRMLVIYPQVSWESDDKISRCLETVEWYGDPSKLMIGELCIIEWWGCPFESLPVGFDLDNLVELIMPWSWIKVLWEGKKNLDKLRLINLRQSQRLIRTPDLIGLPNLELLDVAGTTVTQFPSFGVPPEKLKVLRLGGSSSSPIGLPLLNSFSHFTSLSELELSYCNLMDGALPSVLDCLSNLSALDLSGNKFTRIPDSILQLTNLYYLRVQNCRQLCALPKLPLGLERIYEQGCLSLDVSCDVKSLLTSSEKLVTGNVFFASYYYGSGCQPYKTIHVPDIPLHQVFSSNVAWGPSVGSQIPPWFLRCTNFLETKQRATFSVSINDMRLFWGCALFLVYEVHEPDGNDSAFPVFVCTLLFKESDPAIFAFRVPDFLSVGPNGVWIFITSWHFDPSWLLPPAGSDCVGVSIETSNSNVKLKDCGARFVRTDELYECFEVLNSLSSHDVSKSYEIFKPHAVGEVEEKPDEGLYKVARYARGSFDDDLSYCSWRIFEGRIKEEEEGLMRGSYDREEDEEEGLCSMDRLAGGSYDRAYPIWREFEELPEEEEEGSE